MRRPLDNEMKKILIIDDEIGVRNLFYDALTQAGYVALTASRGDQGVDIAAAEKPDLVLMDMMMPGEKQLSLLQKLRAKMPQLPVVVLSGYVNADIEKESFELGAVEILNKDMGIEELLSKIKKILDAKDKIFNPQKSTKKDKILIVDDEEPIRTFLSMFFQKKGFQTLQAPRGEDALSLVKSEKPSIILLDINMPGMDGVLTLKKIREIDSEVGVVMATAIQDEEIAAETSRLGAYHYVLKPFDLQYLELVVMTRLLIAS